MIRGGTRSGVRVATMTAHRGGRICGAVLANPGAELAAVVRIDGTDVGDPTPTLDGTGDAETDEGRK